MLWRMMPRAMHSVQKRQKHTDKYGKKNLVHDLLMAPNHEESAYVILFSHCIQTLRGTVSMATGGWVCVFKLDLLRFMMLASGEICPRCRETAEHSASL